MKKIFWCISVFVIIVTLGGCVTEMITAARKGDVATMQRLLDQGADINETGGKDLWSIPMDGPPLSHAAYFCQPKAAQYLLSKGADVEGHTSSGLGSFKLRPLHYAAGADCLEVVKILLDAGADINARADGGYGSPLTIAAKDANVRTIKYLIARGGDVDDAIGVLSGSSGTHFGKLKPAQSIALLEKYSRSATAAAPRSTKTAASLTHSDVDAIPDLKVSPRPDAYAVVIGIEGYRQQLPKVDFAVRDAQTVTGYLTKAMGYPQENVVTLLNDHASNVDLVKYFERWLPNNVESNSKVFVYFSGHGAPDPKTGSAYLVPYDGDPTFIAETGYSLSRMYAALGKLPAKNVIVALDSCFSGAGGRSVIAKGARPLVMNLQTGAAISKNMTVLSASAGDQVSSTYDEKGHGLFTYFLLKGIKNEDVLNPDGSLRMDDLYGYLKPQVERIARKQYNNEQTPQLMEGR